MKQEDPGVGYYNILKYIVTKNNKDNILSLETTSPAPINENSCLADASGLASLSASQDIPPQEESGASGVVVSAEKPEVVEDDLERVVIQLFDNGPQAYQRYKVKIRLNLVGDNSHPEFIANLTQDMRNFKKYLPQDGGQEILELSRDIRRQIKESMNTKAYIGKFHMNLGQGQGQGHTQIEPWTFASVWFDPFAQAWSGFIKFYGWEYKFDLFSDSLTSSQKKTGVVAGTLFVNPKYDKRVRPKTWAQLRAEQKAGK